MATSGNYLAYEDLEKSIAQRSERSCVSPKIANLLSLHHSAGLIILLNILAFIQQLLLSHILPASANHTLT